MWKNPKVYGKKAHRIGKMRSQYLKHGARRAVARLLKRSKRR